MILFWLRDPLMLEKYQILLVISKFYLTLWNIKIAYLKTSWVIVKTTDNKTSFKNYQTLSNYQLILL